MQKYGKLQIPGFKGNISAKQQRNFNISMNLFYWRIPENIMINIELALALVCLQYTVKCSSILANADRYNTVRG